MKVYFLSLIIFIISVPIKSNAEYEQSTIDNELDISKFSAIKEEEEKCYAYCFKIVQPILEHTVSIQLKEQQILEQSILLKNLEKKLADLQAKVGIYEESIRNKDLQLTDQLLTSEKYKNETIEKIGIYEETIRNHMKSKNDITIKLGVCEETIKNNDLQLAQQILASEQLRNKDIAYTQQLLSSEKSKNEITVKLGICQEMSEKLKNETEVKTNIIASKEELQSQIKEKLIEYKVKSEICLASSCVGKLNDIYDIKVPGMEAFSVPCDSSLAGSGWTVIQRRKDGSENFNRSWTDYREGFGDLRGEFFIGLEKLYLLTQSQPHELYISLIDFSNETRYARYSEFAIGSEEELYKLNILGSYSGNASDSMLYHKNIQFSTPDADHDHDVINCAKIYSSGWWFRDCRYSNLNGVYYQNAIRPKADAIKWTQWHNKSLKFVQMMIKPK